MDWYYLTLSSDEVAAGKVSQYHQAFDEVFIQAKGPRLMALFQKPRDEGGVDLFFTPESGDYARALLSEWGCLPCHRPSLLGLQLLVGHNEITYYMP